MGELTIRISTGNAAFQPDVGAELSRILHKCAQSLAFLPACPGSFNAPLVDINGNTVGRVEYNPEEDE